MSGRQISKIKSKKFRSKSRSTERLRKRLETKLKNDPLKLNALNSIKKQSNKNGKRTSYLIEKYVKPTKPKDKKDAGCYSINISYL